MSDEITPPAPLSGNQMPDPSVQNATVDPVLIPVDKNQQKINSNQKKLLAGLILFLAAVPLISWAANQQSDTRSRAATAPKPPVTPPSPPPATPTVTPTTAPSCIPTLMFPKSGSVQQIQPTLRWNGCVSPQPVRYQVNVVGPKIDFVSPPLSETSFNTVKLPFVPGMSYTWKVLSCKIWDTRTCLSGISQWSAPWLFWYKFQPTPVTQ